MAHKEETINAYRNLFSTKRLLTSPYISPSSMYGEGIPQQKI